MNVKNIFSGILIVYIAQSIMSRPIQTFVIAVGSFYIGRTVDHPALDYAEAKITEKMEEGKEFISHLDKSEKKDPELPKSYAQEILDKIWSDKEK